MSSLILRVAVGLAVLACTEPAVSPSEPQLGSDAATYWPDATWRTTAPGRVGMDEARLGQLVARLRSGAIANVHELVIVRRGYLVLDETFNGWDRDSIHTMQSVTKSVASLLTGIAIARGELAGVDRRVLDLFPSYENVANVDDRKRAMTVASSPPRARAASGCSSSPATTSSSP